MGQPSIFSYADRVYHLLGWVFFPSVLGWCFLTVMCRWSVMNYSGHETCVWPRQPIIMVLLKMVGPFKPFEVRLSVSHLIYPLTTRVVWAPQMISQPVSSIFPCSPLRSGTCRTPGLSIHSLMLSSHIVLCLPCLLLPFTVPCKMVLARPGLDGLNMQNKWHNNRDMYHLR